MRLEFLFGSLVITALVSILTYFVPWAGTLLWFVILPLLAIGFQDFFQVKHAIRRNFPIVGRFRYKIEHPLVSNNCCE